MFDLYIQRLRTAEEGGVHTIPKHHLALHLFDGAPSTDNPREFANWYDEHVNATLAKVAKLAYPVVYERRVLSYFALAYASQLDQRK